MQKYDIYQVKAQLGFAEYARPCVVLRIEKGGTCVALISSRFDLYDPILDFVIEKVHPDFLQTGLDRRCYIMGSTFPKQNEADFICKRGSLSGSLLDDFLEWYGE